MKQMVIPTYISEHGFSVKGFFNFCRENTLLVITSLIILLAAYGVNLTHVIISIDTDIHLDTGLLHWMVRLGRYGYSLLEYLWIKAGGGYNPFMAEFLGCLFLYFGTLVWCYLLDVFSGNKVDQKYYVFFSALFICHRVWVQQLYFRMQCAESMLIILVTPIAIFLAYDGLMSGKILKVVCSCFVTAFCISIYQSAILLFSGGIFAVFLLFKENTDLPSKTYFRLCMMLLILMIGSVICYLLISKIFALFLNLEFAIFRTGTAGEQRLPMMWEFVLLIYRMTVGNFLPAQLIAEPVIAKVAKSGWNAVYEIRKDSVSVFFTLELFIYFVFVIRNKKRSPLYIIVAVCVFLTILILPMAGGGGIGIRTQYSFPLVTGFMVWYIMSHLKKGVLSKIITIFFCLYSLNQIFYISMLNYTELRRYEYDVAFSQEVYKRIEDLGVSSEAPVLFYGEHDIRQKIQTNYLKDEFIGTSSFGISSFDNRSHAAAFMRVHGYDIVDALKCDGEVLEKLYTVAETMPDWPDPNSVKYVDNAIIVRFSGIDAM